MVAFDIVLADLSQKAINCTHVNTNLLNSISLQTGVSYMHISDNIFLTGTWNSVQNAHALLSTVMENKDQSINEEIKSNKNDNTCIRSLFNTLKLKFQHQKHFRSTKKSAYHSKQLLPSKRAKRSVSTKQPRERCFELPMFKCSNCEESFTDKLMLDVHVLSNHLSSGLYQCHTCSSAFKRESALKFHINSAHQTQTQLSDDQNVIKSDSFLSNNSFNCDELPDDVNSTPHKTQKHKISRSGFDGSISCDFCSNKFQSEFLYKKHFKLKHSDQCCSCHICKRMFVYETDLSKHKENCKETSLSCIECNQEFKSRVCFREHVNTVHKPLSTSQSLVNCEYCTEKIKEGINIRSHIKMKHPESCLTCIYCQKLFVYICDLDQHYKTCKMQKSSKKYNQKAHKLKHEVCLTSDIQVKPDQRSLSCQECSENFIDISDFNKHMISAHADSSNNQHIKSCKYCRLSFDSETFLLEHERSHEKGEDEVSRRFCKRCSSMFPDLVSLHDHIRNEHDGKLYKCSECSENFLDENLLNWHLTDVHGAKEVEYQCNLCNQAYSVFSLYTKHLKTHGVLANRAQCLSCGKSYSSLGNLKQHIEIQHEGKRFKCTECSREFKSPHHLREHIGKIHNISSLRRTFNCKFCNKTFQLRSAWYQHEKHHTNPELRKFYHRNHLLNKMQPAACPICHKMFKRRDAMYLHKNFVHGGKRKPCPTCGRLFADTGHLRRHMEHVHSEKLPRGHKFETIIVKKEEEHSKFLLGFEQSNIESLSDLDTVTTEIIIDPTFDEEFHSDDFYQQDTSSIVASNQQPNTKELLSFASLRPFHTNSNELADINEIVIQPEPAAVSDDRSQSSIYSLTNVVNEEIV